MPGRPGRARFAGGPIPWRRGLAGAEIFAGLQGRHADEGAQHRAVDMGAAPGLAGLHQGRGNGIGGIEPGAEIAHRNAALHRRAARLSGHAHQPAHRLHGDVEGALAAIGAALSEPRYGTVDKPGIGLVEGVVAEPQALEHPGPEVLHHHVRDRRELAQPRHLGGVLQVGRDAALVAVERGEVLAVVRCAARTARAGRPGQRRPVAHAVAAVGPLDLHHVGAQVGEQRTGKRTGGNLAELHHLDAAERAPFVTGPVHGCYRSRSRIDT
jgi:hypothetical protein